MRARLGTVAFWALGVAAVLGLLLVVAALVVPAYDSDSASSSGATESTSSTIVGVNGLGALAVMAVPLLATALVAAALWLRAKPLAWAIVALLAAGNVLALASVGLLALPVTAALVVACLNAPAPQPAAVASPTPG